ncbi:MAG: S24 family peptidase [Eubacteriales bacterium]|nr:S24 family peptidase [Eubacteriales bacterium]
MNTKSTEVMNRILSFVDGWFADRHVSPSIGEIAKGVGIGKTTAYRYLVEMDEKGMLEYDGPSKRIVTRTISRFSTDTASCPVVGSIPCGSAENEEENILEYVSLPASVFGKGELYILKASGDSMTDEGIDDGDLIVIRKTAEAVKGDIIVALTGENENTLKMYGGVDGVTHEAVLLYRNEEKYPGKEIRVKELTVQGVARHIIKDCRNRTAL